MRKTGKRMCTLALVLAFLLTMGITALAEGTDKSLSLKAPEEPSYIDQQVILAVVAGTADTVTDGKLKVEYDFQALDFTEAQAGAAWKTGDPVRISVKDDGLGTLIVTFAGVDPAQAGTVLELNFTALKVGSAQVSLDAEGSYITGGSVAADQTTVVISEEPTQPTEPEPTQPTGTEPTEPEPTQPTGTEPTQSTEPEPTQTEPTQTDPTQTQPTESQAQTTEPDDDVADTGDRGSVLIWTLVMLVSVAAIALATVSRKRVR